jgi:lambda family phage tail tape measure protein
METLRKRRQFLQFMQQQDALAGRTGPENLDARDLAAHPALVPSSGYQSPDLHKGEQELRLFIRAQQQLEEELGKINELTKAEIVINRVSTGSWKDLTDEHKAALIALAGEYDDRQLQLAQQKQFVEGWQNQARVIQASRNVQKEQLEAYRAERDELQFQATLLDKTPRQLELANAERKIELDMRSAWRQLPRDDEGEILPGAVPPMDAILEQAEQQKKVVRALIADRQAAERDWLLGAKRGFAEYEDAATNAAQNTHDFITNSLSSMEGAFVQWARTGKLESRGLAEAIIADFIRISTRQNITGPLAGYLGGLEPGRALHRLGLRRRARAAAGAFDYVDARARCRRVRRRRRDDQPRPAAAAPLRRRRHRRQPAARHVRRGRGSNEAYVPLPDGRRIPVQMSGQSQSGHTFIIDARGADRSGLAQLQALITRLDGSVEYRAVAAVRRSAALARALGGVLAAALEHAAPRVQGARA